MTTDTGMTAVGTIVETIGAETTGAGISGVEINGVESKPAGKPSAVVIGSATRIGPCGTVTRTIAVTIVASAKPRNNPGRKQPFVTGRNRLWIQPVDATDWLFCRTKRSPMFRSQH